MKLKTFCRCFDDYKSYKKEEKKYIMIISTGEIPYPHDVLSNSIDQGIYTGTTTSLLP